MTSPLAHESVRAPVSVALAEDVGGGDLTTDAVIDVKRRAVATLVSREDCVVAGVALAAEAFRQLDPTVKVEELRRDGDVLTPGTVVLRAEGSARRLLTAERVALNFVQRLSGIATLTRKFVAAASVVGAERRVKILHTRKTTPGLRLLERYAVLVGGGMAHRSGLYDEVLLKENHFALSGHSYPETIRRARAAVPAKTVVGAEALTRDEAQMAIDAGVDYVLLDNFSPEGLAAEVAALREHMTRTGSRAELEASGGVRLENVALYAATGVDRISCGALTHSARSIDFSLDVVVIP